MSAYQPFVGEHAEYYRRKTVRDVAGSAGRHEPVMLENRNLRRRILELEAELSAYGDQDQLVESPSKGGSFIRKFLLWISRRGKR